MKFLNIKKTPTFKTYLLITLLFAGFNIESYGQNVPRFTKGDRVGFLGNSITRSGMYHEFIHLFHLTRYPYQKFRSYNFGISGDTSPGGIYRWHNEIEAQDLSHITVMFGMNDIGRSNYTPKELIPADTISYKKSSALADYESNMDSLLWMLKESGTEVILLTPSIYEQATDTEVYNNFGVNDGLGKMAQLVRNMAKKYGMPIVDFHEDMTRFSKRVQAVDPSFSLIGKDRIHPQYLGHFFMFYSFLKEQQHKKYVAKIEIDYAAQTSDCTNCELLNIEFEDNLSFNALEFSLPFPQNSSISEIRSMLPFDEEYNQEILKVQSLPMGQYELWIDEELVMENISALQLSNGVNLALLENTPQAKQAFEVMELNRKMRSAVSDSVLSIKMVEHFHLRDFEYLEDKKKVKEQLKAKLETIEGKPYHGFFKNQHEKYLSLKSQQSEIEHRVDIMQEKVWEINRPQTHSFILKKTN